MMKRKGLLCMGFLLLFLLFSGCSAEENSIAWHIGLTSASQIETVRIYSGFSASDAVNGVIRAESADLTGTGEGRQYIASLFSTQAEKIQAPEAALPGTAVKGMAVFALKTDSRSAYQEITIRIKEADEEGVTVEAYLRYSEAERLRRMEEEDHSLGETRFFVLKEENEIWQPGYLEKLAESRAE